MSIRTDYSIDQPDALSSVVSKLDLRAEVYMDGRFCGNWAVDTSGHRKMPFHLIAHGEAWLHFENQPPTRMGAGDMVVFPRDDQHIICHGRNPPDQKWINQPPEVLQHLEETPDTRMICGFFEFRNQTSWPLLDSLDSMIFLGLQQMSETPSLRLLIDLLVAELQRKDAGFHATVNQISFLMFIEILRLQIRRGYVKEGLLTAFFDPKLSNVLTAIHNQPQESWTLEKLSKLALMGRSTFAQYFHEKVGIPAMQYLSQWRMTVATNLLKTTDLSIAQISDQVGYETEAAFRKAYKNRVGIPPGQIRKTN
ncbi:AraC family transcriptional regulator [Sessilibacter corallicola]|uniref:AraC family transcriptional regulator n=1 Tax=Sessilibacter corallicola TaxID=2904075 RepID=A0ABQ0AAE2_9GAMM|nr:AraC family transcriptional regulator [Sessilibacter corallicola]MCE2029093.1 AraC family transcriptional regulator [Sessilibacter corallicola]